MASQVRVALLALFPDSISPFVPSLSASIVNANEVNLRWTRS